MKIPIKSIQQHVPGRGMVLCNEVNVTVGHYELGGEVRGNYELLTVVPPESAAGRLRDIIVSSGHVTLKPEQLEDWGRDDMHFVRLVAQAAGFELA